MKTQTALTTRPEPGLADLKCARSILRITSEILGKPVVPAHNHTDEQGRWTENGVFADGDVCEGEYVSGKQHGKWVAWLPDGTVEHWTYRNGEIVDE